MSFPTTKRYLVHLLPGQAGLTPAFAFAKRVDTGANVATPAISELGGAGNGQGWYFFDWVFATANDADVVFVINGGSPAPIDPSVTIEGVLRVLDIVQPNFPFPATKRYSFHYLPGQVGLTPTFSLFKRTDTGVDVVPPTILETGGAGNGDGWYYFDWNFSTAADPPLAFLINGNAPAAIDPSVSTYGVIQPSDLTAPPGVFPTMGIILGAIIAQGLGLLGQLGGGSADPGITFQL